MWIPCYRRWMQRDTVLRLASWAEQRGFGSLWVQDHVVAPLGDATEQPVDLLSPWLEPDDYGNDRFSAIEYYGEENWWLDPYIMWGFLAACTERVELGSNVLVLPYRDPIVQAKMLGTLDVLTNGRMLFGVGVGHIPGEFETLGISYRERGRITDEYLRVIATLLGSDEASFEGETIRFGPVRPLIQPVTRPHPPFLIGGNSKRAVRRAVDLGDEWIPASLLPHQLAIGMEYLAEYAETRGKPAPPVTAVVIWGIVDPEADRPPSSRRAFRSVAETADLIGQFAQLGAVRLVVDVPNPNLAVTMRQYELLAQAADQVGGLVQVS